MANVIGIDVSVHNGKLDWKAIKAAGIDFAIIRAGYGRYDVDKCFVQNIKGALEQGIPVGIYWFSYALNVNSAKQEAEKCIKTIAPYKEKITLPVFFDFEYDTVRYAKDNGLKLGKSAFNSHTVAFCEAVKAAGYVPGVYYNLDYYRNMVDKSKLKNYVIWYAQYASKPSISDYTIWQYTSSGKLAGNTCKFDMNVAPESFLSGTEKPEQKPQKSLDEVAKEVINGTWGNGENRKQKLIDAGYDYDAVQKRVNEILTGKKSIDEIAREVINGKWGNGSARKRKLISAGYDYSAVQKRVNEMLG